jgi:3-methyl-2-oxobutanoate hydroxymethyltransferase
MQNPSEYLEGFFYNNRVMPLPLGGNEMKQTTDFLQMKEKGEAIAMLTAYDYPSAKHVEQSGTDIILVGDSLGMVVLGYDSTIPVTVEDMIHHTKAVKRGAKDTFILVDLPFMSYHLSIRDTLLTSTRILQETGANGVKLEGADGTLDHIRALKDAGIPVCAHLGLTPQSVGVLGGYKVQGKSVEEARKLVEDAKKCEKAGAFMIVLECVPKQLAAEISGLLTIPTIGIGAGVGTDGQVIVYHDVTGYGVDRIAKFVKQYSSVDKMAVDGLKQYVTEVKSRAFPDDNHSFTMKEETLQSLYGGKI